MSLYVATVILFAEFSVQSYHENPQADKHLEIVTKIGKALGYWTTFTNCIACIIMSLVVLHVHRLTQQSLDIFLDIQTQNIITKRKMNTFVTTTHIVLILSYTVLSFLGDNVFNKGGTT